jgi:hypothetical protein
MPMEPVTGAGVVANGKAVKDKEKARKHKWRRKTVRVFSEIYDDFYYFLLGS